MGLLKYTMSGERLEEPMPFRNFFSGRILWDEAMANSAFAWTRQNPGGLLVGLVGADHVKFRNGIPGRYARMAKGNGEACVSVMLNPTLIDTREPGSVGMEGAVSNRPDMITLQLRYLKDDIDPNSPERTLPSSTGGVLALADYLVVG
jgi:Haem-binding uptake, Tiki superfamily, ChaN